MGKGWFGWIIKGTYKGQPVVVQVGPFFPETFLIRKVSKDVFQRVINEVAFKIL